MYFHAAAKALEAAKRHWPEVERKLKIANAYGKREAELLEKYGGDWEAATADLEWIGNEFEEDDLYVGILYGPVLENLAITQILCGASLEAHINHLAKERLTGKWYNDFDKLSVPAKWSFLLPLCKKEPIDVGSVEMKAFNEIVGYRNSLMHYKLKKEVIGYHVVPPFLHKLGLTIEQGEKSVKATRELVDLIDTRLEVKDTDRWPDDPELRYFRYDIEPANRQRPRKG